MRREHGEGGKGAEIVDGIIILAFTLIKMQPLDDFEQITDITCLIFFFFNKFIYLFIYFWLPWVFIAVRGLSLVAVSGGCSLFWCTGFSLRWLLFLRSVGFSSRGAWAQ